MHAISHASRLALPCRSEFRDEFDDARGFGWDIKEEPLFQWKSLIQKKVTLIPRAHLPMRISYSEGDSYPELTF